MIGVAAAPAELEAAAELFELFKTVWEPAVPGKHYAAVLSAGRPVNNLRGDFFLVYGSAQHAIDLAADVGVLPCDGPVNLAWGNQILSAYGAAATFECARPGDVGPVTWQGQSASYRHPTEPILRIGYDLLAEIEFLLRDGQPAGHAMTPTLELHIALLRSVLVDEGVSFVEIPPRPEGRDFICCLTHDIDFCGLRRHWFDRTLAGFVARASVGSAASLIARRRSLAQAARNWLAICSLPFVFLGLMPDPWRPFEDYSAADGERPSTFFVVPFKKRPGIAPDGRTDPDRAVKYEARDVLPELERAAAGGREIGVHGIDAWRDADAGRAELAQVALGDDSQGMGVRMHWLYFAGASAEALEAAGYAYDSSVGYNDAVGFRAGTSQVFRLPGTRELLELPLVIMDTALFYRDRLGLSSEGAAARCGEIVANVRRFGGTLVINWHDRSLAPERLWDEAYRTLLHTIESGAYPWFATARQAVDWFRWRRTVRFCESDGQVTVDAGPTPTLPAVVELHTSRHESAKTRIVFDGRHAVRVSV
jgi:hypothetical protein